MNIALLISMSSKTFKNRPFRKYLSTSFISSFSLHIFILKLIFQMSNLRVNKKGIYLVEQIKNHELNLEHVDEEMRMEQVRQASSKLDWASFGQAVRRNLLVSWFFFSVYWMIMFRRSETLSTPRPGRTCSRESPTWGPKCRLTQQVRRRKSSESWRRALGKSPLVKASGKPQFFPAALTTQPLADGRCPKKSCLWNSPWMTTKWDKNFAITQWKRSFV